MLDPVAVRSYLSSMGQQQGGGAQGGGGVAAMLANLRNRLYGSQAAQQMGGQPAEPAWMTLQRAGQQGTGSAAGNRAAAATLPVSSQPGIGGGAYNPATGETRRFGGVAPAVDGMSLPPAVQEQGGGGRSGRVPNPRLSAPLMPPPGGQFDDGGGSPFGPPPPGATWKPDPSMADTGGGLFVGADGQPVDYNGQPLTFLTGGGPAPRGGAAGAQLDPPTAFGGGPEPQPGPFVGGMNPQGGAPHGPRFGEQPQFQSGGGFMAPPPRTTVPKPTAGAPSPTALGADQFRGPNARRIVNARQGIYNNVRQALRRPVGTGGK